MFAIDEQGYAFVAAREGCVLTTYQDSHNPANGFGQNDPTLKPGDVTTMESAIARFVAEGRRIETVLNKLFAGVDLQQQHVNALFSGAYNCGTGTIRDDADLLSAVAAYRGAPKDTRLRDLAGMQVLLLHPKDRPVPFNLSRRCREALVFVSGDYGDLSRLMYWGPGKSPKNTPPDPAQSIPMPRFLP